MLIENSIDSSILTIDDILKDNPIYLEQKKYFGRFNYIDEALASQDRGRIIKPAEIEYAKKSLIGLEITSLVCLAATPILFGALSGVNPYLLAASTIYFMANSILHYGITKDQIGTVPSFDRLKERSQILAILPLDHKILALGREILKPVCFVASSLFLSQSFSYPIFDFAAKAAGFSLSCFAISKLTQKLLDQTSFKK